MEVQHPHHPAHKKKWNEYLLEFFMLFLAVFLGFTAENLRESKIERHREHQFMESLVRDVKTDTANAQMVINQFNQRLTNIDSLINYFGDLMKGDARVFMRNVKVIHSFADFYTTEGTIQQLKNAGGLRLIRNKTVVDSIMRYDAAARDTKTEQDHLGDDQFLQVWRDENHLLDSYKEDSLKAIYQKGWLDNAGNMLLTTDRQTLVTYYANLGWLRENCTSWISNLANFKKQGTRLIELLKKEYHLED